MTGIFFFFILSPVRPFLKPSNKLKCPIFCAMSFSDSLYCSGKHDSFIYFKWDTFKVIKCNLMFELWECRDINAFHPPILLIPHINSHKCLFSKYHLHFLVWSFHCRTAEIWQKLHRDVLQDQAATAPRNAPGSQFLYVQRGNGTVLFNYLLSDLLMEESKGESQINKFIVCFNMSKD